MIDHTRTAINHLLSNSIKHKSDRDALRSLLYVVYLEREFLQGLAIQIGGDCWWGIDFNYHTVFDSVKVGKNFEMIIAPDINLYNLTNVKYTNISLAFQGDTLNGYEFKPINGAVYFKFKPKTIGDYYLYSELSFEGFEYV